MTFKIALVIQTIFIFRLVWRNGSLLRRIVPNLALIVAEVLKETSIRELDQ